MSLGIPMESHPYLINMSNDLIFMYFFLRLKYL